MSSPAAAAPSSSVAVAAAAKPNKPSNSNFRQQRLVSWQPIMSPPHVSMCLVVVALAFVPLGIAIILANNSVNDVEFRYDNETQCELNKAGNALFAYPNPISPQFTMGCLTVLNFTLTKTFSKPVYLYYKLTNFYQNHRRFAKSRSDTQLAGQSATGSSISDCSPFDTAGSSNSLDGTLVNYSGRTRNYGSFTYSPCGLVPWSMFNDTFALYYNNDTITQTLICDGAAFSKSNNSNLRPGGQPCHKQGITWSSDSDKYKTPILNDDYWTANRALYYNAPAPNTTDPFITNGWYAGEAGHEVPVVTDQDLQVWMRTAALPDFRKLYRVIDVDLPAGSYSMVIREFFPVSNFGGTKRFALSTLSWVGGENAFLGIAYVVVGGVSLLLAIIFFVAFKVNGDRMQRAIDSLSELQL